jgi:Sec-independent protein secretion pathway component TatC
MPTIVTFLLQFENLLDFNPINIQIQLKLEEYFKIYIQLIYIFNLTFLIPFISLLINNIK